MTRNFVAELKARNAAIDAPVKPQERLFNIRKRSLPPAVDKLVGIGFTWEEAVKALHTHLFKAKVENDRLIYFDLEEQGRPETAGLFFNPRPFVKPEGSDSESLKLEDYKWIK